MLCNYEKPFSMGGIVHYIRGISKTSMMSKIALVVKVGSMMEERHEHGLSHFLEHMLVDKMKHQVQDNHVVSGTFCHAYTNFHETVYIFHAYSMKEDETYAFIFQCMNTINEILSGTGLNPNSMERVRKDVQNEHSTSNANKETAIKDLFVDALPNIHLSIGDISCINEFSFDDVLGHHRRWYIPNNAAIIIESNLEVEKIESFISKQNIELQINPLIASYLFNNGNTNLSCTSGINKKHDENFLQSSLYFISKARRLVSSPKKHIESLMNLDLAIEALMITVSDYLSLHGIKYLHINGTMEIFSNDWHMIRFKIALSEEVTKMSEIIQYLKLTELNINAFYKTKNICRQKIIQNTNEYIAYGKEFFIDECIQNFLFSEPIIELSKEIIFARNAIGKASFKNVQRCYDYIKRNCVIVYQQL